MEQEIEQVTKLVDIAYNFLVTYSFQILGAVVVFVLGYFVSVKVSNWVLGFLTKRNIDITLSRFTASAVKIFILAVVGIIVLGKLGISVTPLVAAIGALSLGAGLALQGLLSNYGAGISIVVTRPFTVGDTINLLGVKGVVKEVHLGFTKLSNEDKTIITIPNKHIIGEIIHNSRAFSVVESSVGIAYHSDPDKAIATIAAAIEPFLDRTEDKEPQIGIENFGDSSIDIGIRFWVPTEKYFETKYAAYLAIFKALNQHGIDIPFPQRHVHLFREQVSENG